MEKGVKMESVKNDTSLDDLAEVVLSITENLRDELFDENFKDGKNILKDLKDHLDELENKLEDEDE